MSRPGADKPMPVGDGRIPFRVRIGVTGHRDIDVTDALVEAIDRVIIEIVYLVGDATKAEIQITVVSALARGADQLVAQRVLRHPGATLEVIIPYDLTRYRESLGTDPAEFDRLLALAESVQVISDSVSVENGYEFAGRAVVDRSDILIAVWDGGQARGKGGTAEVVDYAEWKPKPHGAARCPVVVVKPATPQLATVTADRHRLGSLTPLKDATAYNRHNLYATSSASLLPEAKIGNDSTRELVQWIAPYYSRADALAIKAQRRYVRLGLGIVTSSAVALVSAAIAAIFEPEPAWPIWLEIFALVVMIASVGLGKRHRYHTTWISNRFLAERFRSALFLAAAGVEARSDGVGADVTPDSQNDWVRRAFTEVWRTRPIVEVPLEAVRHLAADEWVDDQVRYHRRTAAAHERKQRRALVAIWVLLVLAVGVATAHLFWEHTHEEATFTAPRLLSLVSIILPAFGGAITAVTAQRDHESHHLRHDRIASDLARLRDQLRVAKERADLIDLVIRAEGVMISENRDWFGSMRFHDFEPHV